MVKSRKRPAAAAEGNASAQSVLRKPAVSRSIGSCCKKPAASESDASSAARIRCRALKALRKELLAQWRAVDAGTLPRLDDLGMNPDAQLYHLLLTDRLEHELMQAGFFRQSDIMDILDCTHQRKLNMQELINGRKAVLRQRGDGTVELWLHVEPYYLRTVLKQKMAVRVVMDALVSDPVAPP